MNDYNYSEAELSNLDASQEKPQTLIATIILNGGFGVLGGVGNYYADDTNNDIVSSCVLGGIVGICGGLLFAGALAKRFKQTKTIRHEIVSSLVSGLTYKQLLGGGLAIVTSFFTLQTQVKQLESSQIEQIETINEIATAQTPSEQKKLAIKQLSEIAATTDNPEIAEKAIAATDETAEISNPELKIEAINNMLEIALDSKDAETIANIRENISEYATGGFDSSVTEAANKALTKIENKTNNI